MSPDNSSRSIGVPARLLLVSCIIGILLLISIPAAAQPPGVNHRRGQAAIDHLASRLPAVAAQHNVAAARLRELFLTDPYIAVDEADNLLFIDEFVPEQAEVPSGGAAAAVTAALTAAETFQLHSLPGSTKVLLLDFDGHTTAGTPWNNSFGATIASAPYTIDGDPAFSSTELERIHYIWQRVAEDFLPYGVDVTTQDPGAEALRKYGTNDAAWGQRVVISPSNWYNVGAGGVAYIGSFNWSTDTPCFVFSAQLGTGNEKYTAEAITHEAGHTVGLYHDGVTGGDAYYRGHQGWAPIMGVGYYQDLVQWSKGEYPGANNTEDDLAIMTGYGFSVRPDDHADTATDATPLVVTNSTSVSGYGIIERPDDNDRFSFMTGAGTIVLNVTGAARSPNLDIRAELYDSGGTLVASASPSTSLGASISWYASAGTYTLLVDGAGKGDLVAGYSDYGSLGQYTISGTIVNPGVAQPPVAVATASMATGRAPLTVQFTGDASYDPDGEIASYSWNFGDGTAVDATANPPHTYLNKGVFTAVLTVMDGSNWPDSASVTVTVIGPPEAPGTLTATAVSPSQINLAWTDQSTDETEFAIERSADGLTWSPLATVGANAQSYAHTGLAADTKCYYRVKAVNSAGESSPTNTASATTPAAPALHVGDLDGTRSVTKKSWTAKVTILVHDAAERPASGAAVSGSWGPGTAATCTTGTSGTCVITVAKLAPNVPSVTFFVTNVVKSGSSYDATANHERDGDSTGTAITIAK
jgi:PKD repeat protein